MKINELVVNQISVIKKDIIIENIKCQLTYMGQLLNNSPKKIFSIFKEDSSVACIRISDDIYFEMYCEEIVHDDKEVVYIFEVYSHTEENGEIHTRNEYIPEIISYVIEDEAELVSIIKDLMDRVYFK